MTHFERAMARANALAIKTYSRPLVLITRYGVTVELAGIVSAAGELDSGLPLDMPGASVSFPTVLFSGTGGAHGDILMDGTDEYRILDVVTDDGGMTHVRLGPKNVTVQL